MNKKFGYILQYIFIATFELIATIFFLFVKSSGGKFKIDFLKQFLKKLKIIK
jgi:hypothetical protein